MMKHALCATIATTTLLTGLARESRAQDPVSTYTSVSTIQAEGFDEVRSKALSDFLNRSLKDQAPSALTSEFCKQVITQPTPSADTVKLALALVEADLLPILSFKSLGTQAINSASTTYSIEFSLDTVTIKSSNPRYQSQSAGLRVAYPYDNTKPVWYEGKDDTSILFLVPPVRDCNVQFVVACPRTYSKSRTLEESGLELTGVKYLVSSRADGLFKAPQGEEGKVVASTLATSRIMLPSKWLTENISADTPASSVRIQRPLDTLSSTEAFAPISLPSTDAVESHLEFGTTSSVKRVVRARTTVEFTPFKLEAAQPVRIERSDVPLNPGSCIVISRRKETHY